MKKKTAAVMMTMVLGMTVAACGQQDLAGAEQTGSVEAAETAEGTENAETAAKSEAVTDAQTEAQDGAAADTQTEAQSETETGGQTEASGTAGEAPAGEASVTGGYEDNFAVDESAVVEFGTKIKDAVAAKDLEALADLTSFPVYVGFTDQSETPETRDEFIALGADRIFTQELMDSVAGAELAGQQPSMAGFVAASGDGPNIIFGVVEGELAITGFNY